MKLGLAYLPFPRARRRAGLRRVQLVSVWQQQVQRCWAELILGSLQGSSVEELTLEAVELAGGGVQGSALRLLRDLPSLQRLTLRRCSLCPPDQPQPAWHSGSSSSSSAEYPKCPKDEEDGLQLLPHSLTQLKLQWCHLAAISASLAALPRLADLNLKGNPRMGEALKEGGPGGSEGVFGVLPHLTALRRLDLKVRQACLTGPNLYWLLVPWAAALVLDTCMACALHCQTLEAMGQQETR